MTTTMTTTDPNDELPGVDEYLTLLDKASNEVPYKHDELFKEPVDDDNKAG